MRGGGVTLLMLCAAVLVVTNVGTEAASVEEDVVMPLETQGSALGDSAPGDKADKAEARAEKKADKKADDRKDRKVKKMESPSKAKKAEDKKAAEDKQMANVEALNRDKLAIQKHKLQFAKLEAQKDLKRANEALSAAENKPSKYKDENVKSAKVGVAQAKLALLTTTNELKKTDKLHKEAVRLSDGAVVIAKKRLEEVDERTTKLKVREAVVTKKERKEAARRKIESALQAAVVAKQMARAAKVAVVKSTKKTVATESLAAKTSMLAQHAVDTATDAALKAEDASIMATQHDSEVKASVDLREERLRRDLRRYQRVADRVGKGKIERGKRYMKEGKNDLKAIAKRLKEGKQDYEEAIKRSKKTVKYLRKRYKGKKTMSANEQLKALEKKEQKTRDRALTRFKNLKNFEEKHKRSVLREVARGKKLKLDGETMMKAPKAEKKEAKAKAARAKMHKSEMKVKAAKAAKSKAAWMKKQRSGEKAFAAGLKKKSAKLDSDLKKKELVLAKAEGELSVQKEKVKMAINPFVAAKGSGAQAKKVAKKEAKAIKVELKVDKAKDAAKKVVKTQKKKVKAEKKVVKKAEKTLKKQKKEVKSEKKSLKAAKKAAKKMKSGKAKKAAKKQLKAVAKQLKQEKKAMSKESSKVKAASSALKKNAKTLSKDKKVLAKARSEVKKAEKKMTKVVKKAKKAKIQTKGDAINAAAAAKLKTKAETKRIEEKAAQASYEQMAAATLRQATEEKNTAQADVVSARQSLDRRTQDVADAKSAVVKAKGKFKATEKTIRRKLREQRDRDEDQLKEKKSLMSELVNAETAYKKAVSKQKAARANLDAKRKTGKGVRKAKEAVAAAAVMVSTSDLTVTRVQNMEKRRKARAHTSDMSAINAGKKAAMLKVDDSNAALASAKAKLEQAKKDVKSALRLRDDANNKWITAQKGMAEFTKGGNKGKMDLAGDWKKISAKFGGSSRVKALNGAVTSAVDPVVSAAPGAVEAAKVNALNGQIKTALKAAPKAMGHTEKAQLGKIKNLEAKTKKEAKQIKKLESKKTGDVAALAADLKQFKTEFKEMKKHIASHITTPYAKAHGTKAVGKPQTAVLKKGATTLKVKKVAKKDIDKTRALRAKARAVLKKEGKPIPAILKKGSLAKMMKAKKKAAKKSSLELGENDEFNSKDLDSEGKSLKSELDSIAKKTDVSHVNKARVIATVTISEDDVANGKRMAEKDAALDAALMQAGVGPKKESLAEKKVELASHKALTDAQKVAAKRTALYKAQLAKVSVAAKAAAQAQQTHGKHLRDAKARVDRNFAALKQERATMSHYVVTDNLHHPDAFLETAEEQDGDTVASMKKALEQTKKDAAKEVAQAQQNAVLAINKVKAQVVQLKAQQTASKEMSQKKVASEVRHVASKAMLAVNAAKVAGALNKGASPAVAKVADDGKKQALIEQMTKSRTQAEKAASVWKADALKLANMEKQKVAAMKIEVSKAKSTTNHASNDVKLSEKITAMFKKVPSVAKKGD